MDPVAAIGLAGNIVQFVDFSWKLLDEAKDLYDSTTGASQENDLLELISTDLNIINERLTAPSAPGAIPDPIRKLASRCKAIADELLEILDSIKVKGRSRKWKSFLQALRSVWKKDQIENLVKRLERLRGEMQIRLQLDLSEKNSAIQKTLDSLIAENRRLAMDSARQLEGVVTSVQQAISQLKNELKDQQNVEYNRKIIIQGQSATSDNTMRSSRTMEELSIKLSTLAEQIVVTASDQTLLKSLWFDRIKQRQENVALSFGKTFEWVLDPSSTTKFENWLRQKNGIYWITGKAGSGKSTLMKFLMNHPEVVNALTAWAGTKRLVNASFFFWNAGTATQKSQEGLFRSILYEILCRCPDMIRTVCASKAETFRPFEKDLEPWTEQQLWHAIGQLKQYSGVTARFCFFIDGLDEYDGDHDRLIEVLETLRGWQEIKLCVSSRPWNEFKDAFGQPSDLKLALEDLTREDIKIYVKETLEEDSRFRKMIARDIRSQDLVQEIVEKARGVFLWIVLVVKSLLSGLRNADRLSDLQMRLHDFPETLEQFFSHMLESVEGIYRQQTAQAFKFALEAPEPLSLLTYSFLDEEDLDNLLKSAGKFLTINDISLRQDDMERRLNGRCKGLLEVVDPYEYRRRRKNLRVDFLHRTVFDFLHTKDMQNMLAANLSPGFEPKLRLCKALLTQAKLLDTSSPDWSSQKEDLLEDVVYYAGKLESDSGDAQVQLMDQISSFFEGRTKFVKFLVRGGCYLYLAKVLSSKPALSSSVKISLLGATLTPQPKKYGSGQYDPKMVKLLLEHCIDGHKLSDVWSSFVQNLQQQRPMPGHHKFQTQTQSTGDDLKQTIKLLLHHGADPHLCIVTGETTVVPKMTGRSADLHKKKVVQITTSTVQEVLRGLLSDEEAREILNEAVKPQSRLRSRISALIKWKKFSD